MTQIFRTRPGQIGYRPPGDPMTALVVGSMAVSGISGIAGAGAQAAAGAQANQFAQINAGILSDRANQAEAEARARADVAARAGARSLGATGAAFGASGVVTGTGSALDVMADQATEVELQKALEMYRGEAEATSLRNQANLVRLQGSAAESAGDAAAGRTLLSTVANVGTAGFKLWSGGAPSTSPNLPGPGTGYTY